MVDVTALPRVAELVARMAALWERWMAAKMVAEKAAPKVNMTADEKAGRMAVTMAARTVVRLAAH
jgi:hypothetical protein